ncbi:MAG: glutamate-5-semialdehyde dehydrogenase [Candidatus Kapabacteria bacterium]|jgi:glutamate-5-semialdehyde dehydrogenase|nr:glutamate-5-semialdehyde dehydrogenase [Candidatus Kapabacteria bacterium]
MNKIQENLQAVQKASPQVALISEAKRKEILHALSRKVESAVEEILSANKRDLDRMDAKDPKYDRLMLTESRIKAIAADIRSVADLSSPLDITLEEKTLENGLNFRKVSVPMGVIGIIYEARPNVTLDAFVLCFKAGSACVLKGGSDAHFSNEAVVSLINTVLEEHSIPKEALYLLPPEREATGVLLGAVGLVDVIIPRGSQGLIDFVRQNSRVPVIETGAGIVHVYFDESGDVEKGAEIIFNAKTRRVSVCNALDTLILHENRLNDALQLVEKLSSKNVVIFADEQSYQRLDKHYPAALLNHTSDEHFGTEFLDYKMSIKTVKTFDEALRHIAQYSSKHSESVVSEDDQVLERFLNEVDAAVVYANVSTAFTDGGQFGFGAEIGISTQKLHARGPMALREITSYKWQVRGNGQIRL